VALRVFLRVIWVLVESGSTNLYFVCVAFFGIERGNIQYIGCVFRFSPSLKKKDEVSVTCSKGAPEESSRCRASLFVFFLFGWFVRLFGLSIAFFGFFL